MDNENIIDNCEIESNYNPSRKTQAIALAVLLLIVAGLLAYRLPAVLAYYQI